jgi:hypothetical protein
MRSSRTYLHFFEGERETGEEEDRERERERERENFHRPASANQFRTRHFETRVKVIDRAASKREGGNANMKRKGRRRKEERSRPGLLI